MVKKELSIKQKKAIFSFGFLFCFIGAAVVIYFINSQDKVSSTADIGNIMAICIGFCASFITMNKPKGIEYWHI